MDPLVSKLQQAKALVVKTIEDWWEEYSPHGGDPEPGAKMDGQLFDTLATEIGWQLQLRDQQLPEPDYATVTELRLPGFRMFGMIKIDEDRVDAWYGTIDRLSLELEGEPAVNTAEWPRPTEVAKMFGVSRQVINNWIKNGVLERCPITKRIDPLSIINYSQAQRIPINERYL